MSTLVPPRRLGALLRQARVAAGMDLIDLAGATPLSVVDLDDLEHGRRMVDDDVLRDLIQLYGVEDAGIVPERSQLVIDLDEGRIAVNRADINIDEVTGPDAVLARYLALVYRLRDLPLGTPIPLRDVDLEILSTALHLETVEVETRLRRLMADEDEVALDQKRIRRRLLLPLVGVVIAASSAGVLVLVAENSPQPEPNPVVTSTAVQPAATDVGTGAIVDADVGSARVTTGAVVDAPEVTTDLGTGAAVVSSTEVETDIGTGGAVVENPDAD